MARSIPALVTPSVLRWARERDDWSVDEIAQKMKIGADRIVAWEEGSKRPTMRQAKDLANRYRVPFTYFYLPSPPPPDDHRIAQTDYRTLGNQGVHEMSRELRRLLRDIEERRDCMLDLYDQLGLTPHRLSAEVSLEMPAEELAAKIRDLLGLTSEVQKRFRKAEVALPYCVSRLETLDFLVFQAAGIKPTEMRGLSVAYTEFPIIVMNRKDAPNARLFTLCHELTHILTRTSSICNDMGQEERSVAPSADSNIERFCNRVAGLALVPTRDLREHEAFATIRSFDPDEGKISELSRDFAVSREVILHRLWDVGTIDRSTYFTKLAMYRQAYEARKSQMRGGHLEPFQDAATQVGKLYARTVMDAYHSDAITLSDASDYLLGLRTKHFPKLEGWCSK